MTRCGYVNRTRVPIGHVLTCRKLLFAAIVQFQGFIEPVEDDLVFVREGAGLAMIHRPICGGESNNFFGTRSAYQHPSRWNAKRRTADANVISRAAHCHPAGAARTCWERELTVGQVKRRAFRSFLSSHGSDPRAVFCRRVPAEHCAGSASMGNGCEPCRRGYGRFHRTRLCLTLEHPWNNPSSFTIRRPINHRCRNA
jgi:hypothetical protein